MSSAQRDSRSDDEDMSAKLAALDQPAEVVGAAGEWLASRLRDDGFVWARSLAKLERRVGVRREQIHLQRSKWNRTGQLVEFGVVLNVRDGALRKWRRANPDLTSCAEENDDWVCGHPLGALTATRGWAQVDLTVPASRGDQLDAFVGLLRAVALPWFDASRDPERIAVEVPDVTVSLYVVDLAEWLVCKGNQEQAVRLVERWLAKDPGRQPDFETGRALGHEGERPDIFMSQWVTVGWSSAVLGLV
ncbi:hypothetical protein AB0H83_35270 [Dactylosporangium sp. NPDC050688]|uniref:hypothetical protein n=1 Tax=Dactylosporangium sp. NPDC050688 TaxID=3157217 RepID=UPI0033C063F4